MPEAPTCCTKKTPGQCDKTQCTCGDASIGKKDSGDRLPGCGISFILKPIDPLQEESYSRTRLQISPSNCSGSPNKLLKHRPSKYSTSPSKHSSASTTSSTKTVHRLKVELEMCTEQMKPQKFGVSMTCLVKWNIAKVVEKHPSIDLEKAIHDCQKKLDIEPCTGQYRLPRCLGSPESEEDRHISCALLAWQAKGETDLDKLVDLAKMIRKATNIQNETDFTSRTQAPRKPSSPPQQLPCHPPNQLSRDQPDQISTEFIKNEFNLRFTEAFHMQESKSSRIAASSHVSCNPSLQTSSSWRERKMSKLCTSSKQCSGTRSGIAGALANKQFYEGLAGPVIKLPDSCPCNFKEFPPDYFASNVPNVVKQYKAPAEKGGQGEKQELDIPVCLEGKCLERLNVLDEGVGALRQRAARLAKRDQERKQLLERAEKAWHEMERGFQNQLVLAKEMEEEIAERMNQLANERNSCKTSCLCGETDLENQIKLVQAAEENLNQMIPAIKQTQEEKQKLERYWKKLDADIEKEKTLAHSKQRDLTVIEERLRTRQKSLSEDLDVQEKLTADVNRALRKELESLKEQFNVVSEQLLQADDQNIALKAKVDKIKETKAEMIAALESCKLRCDNKYDSVKKEFEEKNKQLQQKKEEAFACSCKLPVDTKCQVKRTPSFVAACRCTKPHSGKSCSCTSLKTRMMKDLVKDILEGIRDEISEGTAMPCELLKCMEDDFDWDAGTPLKQKIRDFFEDLLNNELDIAIMTAIEQHHARWTKDSCVDKPRTSKKESKLIVMCVERTASLNLLRKTSVPLPPSSPVSPPGDSDRLRELSPLPTDNENPWKRTQADVFQLSMELKQLKLNSIRRRDLQAMEQNLAKMVQKVVKPRRNSKAEKATSMTSKSRDTFRPTSLYRTDRIQKSHKLSRVRSFSKVTKDSKRNPLSNKVHLLKDRSNNNQKKNAQNRLCVPSFNSTDLCISPKHYSPERPKGSAFSSLLKNVYLDADVMSLAEVKEHRTEITPFTSKKKQSVPRAFKKELYFSESDYQRLATDNVPEVITKPTFALQHFPEVLTIQNTSSYRDERNEKKARRETYNRLISECLQSFTREQISPNSKNNALNHESVHENGAKPEHHFNVKRSEISIGNGSCSIASWKTAQDEEISSLLESVYYSKTCMANKKLSLEYKFYSSTKIPALYNNAETKKLEMLNNDVLKGNTINMNNTQQANYDKSAVGVFFLNKLCSSITSLFSSNKNKSECSCNPENISGHIKSIRGDKSKQTKKSEQKSKLRFKDMKKRRRKSSTSLKSKASLASSTKSKYHKWCALDSSAREALERKAKLKKKSSISKTCSKSNTSKGQSNKGEQAGVQTCSDVCDKACQCDISTNNSKCKTDKSSSMDGQIKEDTKTRKGVKSCLCEFKSMGASLLRDQNAARAYGGDRFGVGPFRGIFGPDQQPLGEARKFPLECEGEAGVTDRTGTVQPGVEQAIASSRSSGTAGQRGLSDEVTKSSAAGDLSGDEILANTDGGPSSKPDDSSIKITGGSTSSYRSGDAKVITCKSRSQSSTKRESFICEDNLSPDRRSVGIGSHKCLCADNVASAQMQTSRQYLSSENTDDDDDSEECVCCSKSDKQNTKDLEMNAFKLLQQYILGKIKKIKCECCPFLNPDIDENVIYMKLLEKIQGVISEDIGKLACRCRDRNDIENSEYMAFSLLEEYIKSKLNEMMCSCNGKHSDVSPDFYTDVLDTIKNVIDNDLADIKCCCHTMINECPCSKPGDTGSGVLNQNSVSDKMCETYFDDQTTQTGSDELKMKSSKCVEGMKKLIGRISGFHLSSDRKNSESIKASKDSSGNQIFSKSFTGGSKSANSNEVESIWCKCLPDRYSSNLSSGVVTSSANLISGKQSVTGKQDGEVKKNRTGSDKSIKVCPCNQKETSGPRISQQQRNGNSKQNFSTPSTDLNRMPVEKQKSSSRQSSPDLNSGSRKNSVTFNRESSVKGQSGSAVISGRRVVSSECNVCKMQGKNFCPVCKTMTSPDSPGEVRDLLYPSQGRTPCGCDPNMKSCTCANIQQRQGSNAINMPYRPNSYGPSAPNEPNSPNMYGPTAPNGPNSPNVYGQSAPNEPNSPNIYGPTAPNGPNSPNMYGQSAPYGPNSPYTYGPTAPNGPISPNMYGPTATITHGSNAMNVYGPSAPNGYGLSATNMYQPNAPNMYGPAPNPYGTIDVNAVPQNQPNTYPGSRNTSASYEAATNDGQVLTADYHGVTLECTCNVNMEPCTCSKKLERLSEATGAGGGFGGRMGSKGGFVSSGRGGATNGSRGSVTNGALGSATNGARDSVNQVKPSPKCCGTCKKKAKRANKSSKPSKMHCDCSEKL